MAISEENHNNAGGQEQSASILVVDDNPLIVDVLRGLLGSVSYKVFTAGNGSEALDVLKSKKVDVIICDVMMPKMGGYELHQAVRQEAEYAHIPFVFLTALDDREEVARGKEAGADDYICKPFEPNEMLAVVRGKVARAQNLRSLSEKRFDSYRRRVIHTLSHEFRTPLVAINTGMELVIDQAGEINSPKTRELLEAVRRGGVRLEKLVNDFMTLQQIDAGIAQRAFDTRAVVRTIGDVMHQFLTTRQSGYEGQGAQIAYKDLSDGAKIRAVDSQLQDMIDRLVSNAVKFSQDSKAVEIETYVIQDEVFIDIGDRGTGLDLDKLDEAIDVFGQIDRARLEQQGGGLGLPIASHYARIHGGRLEFEPRQDGGSIVSIVLPKAS